MMKMLRTTGRTIAALALGCLVAAGVWAATGGFYAASGHGNTTTGVNRLSAQYSRGECGHCHEQHASQDADPTLHRYGLFALEENVCWACHNGTVSYAADVRSRFSSAPPNTPTDIYQHPVSNLYSGNTPSAHRAGERLQSAFGGGSRHAECEDCHDSHAATTTGTPGNSAHIPGGINGNRLAPAQLGATGLVVNAWQAAGQPFAGANYTFQRLTSLTNHYEWQTCFKCHSTFTTLPVYAMLGSGNFQISKITSADFRQVREYQDLGQAFNPQNRSFHPVTATGRNTAIPAGSFVSPWGTTTRMTCSDCHSKPQGSQGALGPHGSSNMHILERPFYLRENTHYRDSSWGANIGQDPNELCFKCHRWQTYVQKPDSGGDPITYTNFRTGMDKNLHAIHMGEWAPGVTCYTCHDVHGTDKEHLINFNVATVTVLRDSQLAYTHRANGGACGLTCHGKTHANLSYAY